MTESSRMPLFDLRKLNASLPVASVNNSSIKIVVLGAKDDLIVVHSTSIHVPIKCRTHFSQQMYKMLISLLLLASPFGQIADVKLNMILKRTYNALILDSHSSRVISVAFNFFYSILESLSRVCKKLKCI